MMKQAAFRFIIGLLLLFMLFLLAKRGCNSLLNGNDNDMPQKEVNNKEKTILETLESAAEYAETTYQMPVSAGKPDVSEKQRIERILYDGRNRILHKWTSGISSPVIYEYHYAGSGVLDSITATSDTGRQVMQWHYKYNEKGLKIAESHKVGADHKVRTFWRYNAAKKPIERYVYINNEKKADRTLWEYAADGFTVLNEVAADESDNIKHVLNYVYDERKREVECKKIAAGGKLQQVVYKKYNDADSLISELRCNELRDPIHEMRYEYDNRGNRVLEVEYVYPGPVARLVRKVTFVYDRKNKLTESWHYKTNPDQAETKREYSRESLR